jgi:hypothetical protein
LSSGVCHFWYAGSCWVLLLPSVTGCFWLAAFRTSQKFSDDMSRVGSFIYCLNFPNLTSVGWCFCV